MSGNGRPVCPICGHVAPPQAVGNRYAEKAEIIYQCVNRLCGYRKPIKAA